MPRNPAKRHCDTPGCNAWAMRGRNLCRSHLDHLLGPRGAGAPANNLNALKTGRDARLLANRQLEILAHQITADPHHLAQLLNQAIDAIHRQKRGPLETLILLGQLCDYLTGRVADHTFVSELDDYVATLPPDRRSSFQTQVWHGALTLPSVAKVHFLRGLIKALGKKDL